MREIFQCVFDVFSTKRLNFNCVNIYGDARGENIIFLTGIIYYMRVYYAPKLDLTSDETLTRNKYKEPKNAAVRFYTKITLVTECIFQF